MGVIRSYRSCWRIGRSDVYRCYDAINGYDLHWFNSKPKFPTYNWGVDLLEELAETPAPRTMPLIIEVAVDIVEEPPMLEPELT